MWEGSHSYYGSFRLSKEKNPEMLSNDLEYDDQEFVPE